MTMTVATSPTILSSQAQVVLEHRYYLKDTEGVPVEDSTELFKRVAKAIAKIDQDYVGLPVEVELLERDFFAMMHNLEFVPNSPTLMNAGTEQGTLSACFVLPFGFQNATYVYIVDIEDKN